MVSARCTSTYATASNAAGRSALTRRWPTARRAGRPQLGEHFPTPTARRILDFRQDARMKLCFFNDHTLGLVQDGRVIDLSPAVVGVNAPTPADLINAVIAEFETRFREAF